MEFMLNVLTFLTNIIIINNLPSLVENDGYFLNVKDMAVMATAYDGVDTGYHYLQQLKFNIGISVNELDPLRDEGLLYYITYCWS